MHKKFAKEGFTLIELTLSILFIAILSLAVALLIANAITAYRRGITLNQINNMGMELTDDMRASVQNAQARSLTAECANFYSNNESGEDMEGRLACEKDLARKFSSITLSSDVKINGDSIGEVPVLGAFCSGSYSYIWNSGYFFNPDYEVVNVTEGASFTYRNSEGSTKTIGYFKLLKVFDEDQEVCKSAVENKYDLNTNFSGGFDISDKRYSILEEEPTDILTSDIMLALYDLSVNVTNESAALSNSLYAVSFILGTEQGGVNVTASGNYCATPEDYEQSSVANFDYCAINKFNFVAQANGG